MTRTAVAMLAAAALVAGGCGDEAGVLVEVTQADAIEPKVDTLHLFVGTPDDASGTYTGIAVPDDVITLAQPLRDHAYTIRLVRSAAMTVDTPVRVAVVGSADGVEVGLAWLDLAGIPDDVMLRYPLELQPVGEVITTPSGCLLLPDDTVVGAVGDRDCDGVTLDGGDCDDLDGAVHPGAFDGCDGDSAGVDDDCNATADDGDADHDGATCRSDCDDADPARLPGKPDPCGPGDDVDNDCDLDIDEGVAEICGDQVDNDCDETSDQGLDDEICGDGADNDCDQAVDEGRLGKGGLLDDDLDGDGASCDVDCDDDDAEVSPSAVERCNQADDDCDAATDEEANDDADPARCLTDCDDQDPRRYPGNPELCDTIDNDCVAATHAAPSPCFDYGGLPCRYGTRACNETLGVYNPNCEPVATLGPQPMGVCDQFLGCAVDPGDRLACAGEPTHLCEQVVMNNNGGVCAGATHDLDGGAAGTCSWAIIGGRMQQGWTVSLLALGSTAPTATAATCQALFQVDAVPAGLQPATFAVALFINDVFDHAEVFAIEAKPSPVCPLPSLSCTLAN